MKRRRSSTPESLDFDLLEMRVRQEVRRLLGRHERGDKAGGASAEINLEILEAQIREMLRRLMVPSQQGSAETRPAILEDFDMAALEGQVRRLLARKLGGSHEQEPAKGKAGPIPRGILEAQVREAVRRFTNPKRSVAVATPSGTPSYDAQLLEQRVRSELARRIPSLRKLGWLDEQDHAQKLSVPRDLLETRMRQAIRGALSESRSFKDSKLSDEDIEQIVARSITD